MYALLIHEFAIGLVIVVLRKKCIVKRIRQRIQVSFRGNVYDVMGRCVLSSPEADGTFKLPAPGIYILRIGNLPPRKVVLVR